MGGKFILMTTETRYINEIQQDSPIIFLEKATDGKVSLEDISKALDEYERLYKAGFATPAELLTLSRAYPENDEYSKALQKMGIGDDDSLVIGGPASIELIDREGHLITTKALEPAFEKYMNNIRNRNVMVLHSDVQVGWALPAYISSEGSIFKSGVDDTGLFFIAELRNDTKISKKVRDQISSGQMKSYSIAGSALKTQTIEKGLLKVMQVDELELAEVTICEKGVNQEAGFEILKGDNVPTKSCSDGSCLTKMQECDCQNATPEVETKPIAHKPMQLLTKKDGKPDYFASLQKWINKGSVNGEDFDYSDAGLQEAIDYATGLMRDKKKVVFEWEDYKKGYNNMTKKDSLLKLAVEVLKELEPGQAYVTSQTPPDAKIDEGKRGGKIWYPARYAAQKEKAKQTKPKSESPSDGDMLTQEMAQDLVREYEANEDKNYHSENLVLLASLYGTPEEKKKTKQIVINRDREGSLNEDDYQWIKANHKKFSAYSKKLESKAKGEKPKADSPKPKTPSLPDFDPTDKAKKEYEKAEGALTSLGRELMDYAEEVGVDESDDEPIAVSQRNLVESTIKSVDDGTYDRQKTIKEVATNFYMLVADELDVDVPTRDLVQAARVWTLGFERNIDMYRNR